MGDLAQSIAEAAVVLEQIVRESRRRYDERTSGATGACASSPAQLHLQESAWIEARWFIAWPTWPPGLRAKATALGQKVLRRLLSWYIEPIVEQQNEFNRAALTVIDELSREVATLKSNELLLAAEQARQLDAVQRHLEAAARQAQEGIG